MADPLHIFHMDKKFAYNGVHMDRSILMGFFASEGPIRPDSYENLTTIVKLSSAGYLVEEDGEDGRLVPAGIVQYPTTKYNDPTTWVTTNIYRFTKQLLDFQDYDITTCFEDADKVHLLIKMWWGRVDDISAYKEVQRFARIEISSVALITPLRVQNIEVVARPGEGQFHLVFTLVAPGLPGHPGSPPEATRTLAEARAALQAAVLAGNFSIEVATGDGFVKATGQSMEEIDGRAHHPHQGPTVTFEQGYTSGDMAGLAIGMLFGGLLVATVIYFFALRNNARASIPVIRGLENPLTGLSNLGSTLTGLTKS